MPEAAISDEALAEVREYADRHEDHDGEMPHVLGLPPSTIRGLIARIDAVEAENARLSRRLNWPGQAPKPTP